MAYHLGDLVWGKMKGFPYWPGIVKEPPKELKNKKVKPGWHCIYFFGSKNYAYLDESCLKKYEPSTLDVKISPKKTTLLKAIEEMEAYISSSQSKPKRKSSISVEDNSKTQILSTPDDSAPSAPSVKSKKKSVSSAPPNKSKQSPKKVESPATPKRAPRKRASSTPPETENKTKRPRTPKLTKSDKKVKSDASEQKRSSSRPPSPALGSVPEAYDKKYINGPSTSLSEPPEIDVDYVSDFVKGKNIEPSSLTFGFLGSGFMGSNIIRNLAHTGHKLVIWNRTTDKSAVFGKLDNVDMLVTPSDVVATADITFCCVDSRAVSDLVRGNCGVLQGMGPNKAYVDMTPIDPETSMDICEEVIKLGGKYLEVRFLGTPQDAIDGSLTVLASGDHSVYNNCSSCLEAVGNNVVYLNDGVGNASKVNFILQKFIGSNFASMAEHLALASKINVVDDFINCMKYSKLKCPAASEAIKAITSERKVDLVLGDLQKSIKAGMNDAAENNLPLRVGAAVHQMFVHCRSVGFGCDPLSLYRALKTC